MSRARSKCGGGAPLTIGFLANGCIPVSGAPEALKRQFGRRMLEVGVENGGATEKRSFPMEGIGANTEFLQLLTAGRIVSMHTLEASLDEVFIKATAVPYKREAV